MKLTKLPTAVAFVIGVTVLVFFVTCEENSTKSECYTVTADTVGMGSVLLSPDSSCFHSGTVVTLTAVPESRWGFLEWSGGASGSANPLLLTISGDVSVTATFVRAYFLTIDIVPEGSGTVTANPDKPFYQEGHTVTLEATPSNATFAFSHWVLGTLARLENPIVIVFDTLDIAITAMFGSLEGEPDCGDGYVDDYNGGCNSDPIVFQDIANGQIYIAKSGIYNGTSERDLDWFQHTVSDTRVLTISAIAEFPLQLILLNGTEGCAGFTVLDGIMANPNDTATVTAAVGPGEYWMVVGSWVFSSEWLCPQDYKAWLTVTQAAADAVLTPGRPAVESEVSDTK